MLVLSRKADRGNDEIVIADNIIVKVLSITGDRVRIGIEADKSISIRPGELDQKLDPRLPRGEGTVH